MLVANPSIKLCYSTFVTTRKWFAALMYSTFFSPILFMARAIYFFYAAEGYPDIR